MDGTVKGSLEQRMLAHGYVTPRKVAEKTMLSIPTVYRMINSGKLRTKRYGETPFVEIASVVEWAGELGSEVMDLKDWS